MDINYMNYMYNMCNIYDIYRAKEIENPIVAYPYYVKNGNSEGKGDSRESWECGIVT
jgi:hypothetical protein